MIYVERNEKGEIVSLQRDADKPGMECKQSMDIEIFDFLGGSQSFDMKSQLLASSDTEMVRILEDVIDLLVSKNLIMFTELPEAVQQKIRVRKRIRQGICQESIIVDDIL
jgi:hypothetical protein